MLLPAGMAAAWLPDGICAGTVFSRLEVVVRHNFTAEPSYIGTGLELAVTTTQLVADWMYGRRGLFGVVGVRHRKQQSHCAALPAAQLPQKAAALQRLC